MTKAPPACVPAVLVVPPTESEHGRRTPREGISRRLVALCDRPRDRRRAPRPFWAGGRLELSLAVEGFESGRGSAKAQQRLLDGRHRLFDAVPQQPAVDGPAGHEAEPTTQAVAHTIHSRATPPSTQPAPQWLSESDPCHNESRAPSSIPAICMCIRLRDIRRPRAKYAQRAIGPR